MAAVPGGGTDEFPAGAGERPMSPERWRLISEAVADALDLPAEERASFLLQATGLDDRERSEALRLIKLHEEAEKLTALEPQASLPGGPERSASRTLSPSQVLCGRFEIKRFIAEGGMGEVYEAWDRELSELVALKTIRPEIAADETAVSRFRHEVQRARKVSHANVCRVYDLFSCETERSGKVRFLTMELLAGQTLAEYLRRHAPLADAELSDIAVQLAQGLAAAHRAGVIHRDFKPANVMLVELESGEKRATITDFGLARIYRDDSATQTSLRSGTPAYMAPEQFHGGFVTPATDVFAFGVVLHEMLTGRRPGARGGDWRKDPAPQLAASPGINPRWPAIVRRCLSPDPRGRFADASELVSAIAPRPSMSRRGIWLAAAVAAIAVVAVLATRRAADETATPSLPALERLTYHSGLTTYGAISPDGDMVAYSSDLAGGGNLDIWVQSIHSRDPARLTTHPTEDAEPAFSPDGKWIAFRSERDGGGIYIVPATGGENRWLVKGGHHPQFSPDGKEVAFWTGHPLNLDLSNGKLGIVAASGGTARAFVPEFADARLPVWSPDGKYLLFQGVRDAGASVDAAWDWWIAPVNGGPARGLGAADAFRANNLRHVASTMQWWRDRLIFPAAYGDAINLWEVVLFDPAARRAEPLRRLTFGTGIEMCPSISAAGRLVFSSIENPVGTWELKNWAGAKPVLRKITYGAARDSYPSTSVDGETLVFRRNLGGVRNVWTREVKTGRERPLTSSAEEKYSPVVDRAGSRVAYSVSGALRHSVFVVSLQDRSVQKVCQDCGDPQDWTPDGRLLLVASGLDGVLRLIDAGTGDQRILLDSARWRIDAAQVSPDGEAVVFTGRAQEGDARLFVAAFDAKTPPAENTWTAVTEEGVWSDKGHWSDGGGCILFFSNRDGFMCLWGRGIDPVRKIPAGPIVPVRHLHDSRVTLGTLSRVSLRIAVTHNTIYFPASEMTGNVWLTSIH